MSPHNFSRKKIDDYVNSPTFINTRQYQIEKNVEDKIHSVYERFLSIPRRFWGALKKRGK
jgi:hypothetical protein